MGSPAIVSTAERADLSMPISAIDHALIAGTIALGLTFAASQAHAWPATAEACHDGDTCTVISATGQRVVIRLHGVDAPELDQPYGAQARLLVNSLVAGQHVDIRPTGDLSYGRTVADIVLPGGSVGTALVASGAAWVEQRWEPRPGSLRRAWQRPTGTSGPLGRCRRDPAMAVAAGARLAPTQRLAGALPLDTLHTMTRTGPTHAGN
jgi:endonuclease YncB( thermonuclease family)